MATAHTHRDGTSEGAIFARLWEAGPNGFSPQLARHVLKLGFSERDRTRMHELAAKNQEGWLNADEQEELDNYVKVGDLLAILQSKARRRLRRPVQSAISHRP
jgi:hypothetical protein